MFNGINNTLGKCGEFNISIKIGESLSIPTTSIIFFDSTVTPDTSVDKSHTTPLNRSNRIDFAGTFECPSLKMEEPWRISITEVKRYVDLDLFHDDETIKNYLIAFQTAYEKHNKDQDLFFASLSPEEQKSARYYLNDFGDQELEPKPETVQQN